MFALAIVFCHSHGLQPADRYHYPFVGGYLAVEFFFILSGYFAAEKAAGAENASGKDALVWTWRKYGRIWRYVIPAVAIHYLANAALTGIGPRDTAKSMLYGIFEMLLLPAAGVYESFLDLPLWYLSAMAVLLPVLYALLLKHGDYFRCVFCPVSAVLIYGFYCVTTQHIDRWADWNGVIMMSLPRAWAGLSLGCFVWEMARSLRSKSMTGAGRNLLAAVEFVCLGAVLLYMFTLGYRRLDFLCILLMAAAAAIVMSGQASVNRLFPSWVSRLSDFSLALYVSHWTVRMLVPIWMPTTSYTARMWAYIPLALAYGALLEFAVKIAGRLCLGRKFKMYILEKGVRQ